MDEAMPVRSAGLEDAEAFAAIYAHHVLHGTATYDTDPPSATDMRDKISLLLGRGWPILVAEEAGTVVGYAYATQFRDRAAYAWACENSVYIRADRRGQGIGRLLLDALVSQSEAAGFRQMVAVIGGAEPASIALHAAAGFREVGRVAALGWKHGRWLDNVYMQLSLGEGACTPPDGPILSSARTSD